MFKIPKNITAEFIEAVLNLHKNINTPTTVYYEHVETKTTRCAAVPGTWAAFLIKKQANIVPFPRAPSSVEIATACTQKNTSAPSCECSKPNFNMSEGVLKNMRRSGGAYMSGSSCQKVTLFAAQRDAKSHFCTCSKWHPAVSDVIFF